MGTSARHSMLTGATNAILKARQHCSITSSSMVRQHHGNLKVNNKFRREVLMKLVILFINKIWIIWQKLKLLLLGQQRRKDKTKKGNGINILWRFVRLGRPKYKHDKSMHGGMRITINCSQICLNLYKSIIELVRTLLRRGGDPPTHWANFISI